MKQQFIPAVTRNEDGTLVVTIHKEIPQGSVSPEPSFINFDYVAEDIRQLIFWRAEHCQNQLAEKLLQGKAISSPSGNYILYTDEGHFSVPVYEAMTEFLAIKAIPDIREALGMSPSPFNEHPERNTQAKGLCQQALRQLIAMYNDEKLSELHNSRELLSNVLTEQLFVL